jgi:hypothetical protein
VSGPAGRRDRDCPRFRAVISALAPRGVAAGVMRVVRGELFA